jgi:hypothetical protein
MAEGGPEPDRGVPVTAAEGNALGRPLGLGGGGGSCGVALTWPEFALSPPAFTAETT